MRYVEGPFLHKIPLDGGFTAFYNSLTMELVFINDKLIEKCKVTGGYQSIDSETTSLIESMHRMELLVKRGSDGLDTYRSYLSALDKPSINILYLLLTDTCNLRCKYCYFLANIEEHHKYSFMSKDVAKRAVDMFVRSVEKSVADGYKDQQIVIYGGEPTLNKDTLVFALNYIVRVKKEKKLPDSVGVTINTNGIKLDEDIIESAKKAGATIAISIDGPPQVHDKLRVYPDGKPTLKNVIEKYRLAKSMGAKTGLCCTVDDHNLGRLTSVLGWLSDELDVKGMGFNILLENKRNLSDEEYDNYSRETAEELIECFKLARSKGIYEDRIMRRVKNFVEKTPVYSDCGGCGLQVVVAPNGDIGVCQAFCGTKEYFVTADLDSFEPEQHDYWKEWRKRSPLSMQQCVACVAFGNCGGGCPYIAYKRKGSIWELDERFCVHAKQTVQFLIKDLWQRKYMKIQENAYTTFKGADLPHN